MRALRPRNDRLILSIGCLRAIGTKDFVKCSSTFFSLICLNMFWTSQTKKGFLKGVHEF